ncbi:putative methyltransferase [Caerostris extrusa]|uniref:Methyltransferase n=1 Tax=Caerostris extrusa TaxID=172846 RepID=A0AAV4WQU0_CAEEX|nr:putative methyltransferase [Caerostris extrusa]
MPGHSSAFQVTSRSPKNKLFCNVPLIYSKGTAKGTICNNDITKLLLRTVSTSFLSCWLRLVRNLISQAGQFPVARFPKGIAPAECLPVGDSSVHLLTAATCFHWLDMKAFFKEADRVLMPGGVLAVYTSMAIYPVTGDEHTDYRLRLITNKVTHMFSQLWEQYGNIEFPFEDIIRIGDIGHTYMGNASDTTGYIKSVSTFQNFRSINPLKADELLKIIKTGESQKIEFLKINWTFKS